MTRSLVWTSVVVLSAIALAAAPNAEKSTTEAPKPSVTSTPKTPAPVRKAMQDRDYDAAVKAIDAAMETQKSDRDYLAYLKGRALHLAEKYDEAITRFDTLEKEFPGSRWVRRADFAKAISHAKKGDYRTAELIYRRQAEYLLSEDRKQQIAELYLEFADVYYKPPKIEQQPDFRKALEFYQKALAVGPKPARRVEVELLVAKCYQNLGELQPAVERLEQFIKDHPDVEQLVEAKYLLGESQWKLGRAADARRTWRDMLAAHAGDKSDRLAEAAYHIAHTYGAPQPRDREDLNLGVAALESFIKQYPDHKLASNAYLLIAQSYAFRGQYDEAAKRLQRYLNEKKYADREETPAARQMLGQALLLQKKFDEALAVWKQYLSLHSTHKSWSQVQQAIVDARFAKGVDAQRSKKFDEARKLYEEFLAEYPLDRRAAEIYFQFGAMQFTQEKWDAAIDDWNRLTSKYPGTNESSRAQLMIGVVLEDKLAKLDKALDQYKKVEGQYTGQARQRIAQLTAHVMTIETERIFRGDETPKIKLVGRNVESVRVEIYPIDMETYFRKMHLAGGVEGLDIELIDPSLQFEFKVSDYAPYQKLDRTIEIPIADRGKASRGGAMAVTVSSKTHVATTLVLQSDLDIVVKSSRKEAFVFAENMRTGKAWADVRLLLSDGKQVFAEGKTGADGVFQQEFSELASAGDLRVLAISNNGAVASNVVSLSGVGMAKGLQDKGYVYSDRPAYRPGDLVHLRGVIRGVKDDAYTVDAGAKFMVEVFDVRSRLLHRAAVELNSFGSFHSHFILPSEAVQGNYRVVATQAGKSIRAPKAYQGAFSVQQFQLEPIHIQIDSDRSVYYRGEEIEGKVKVAYYYGAPLVDREVRYRLADGPVVTAKTDAKGEIAFKLPTREFRESQTLPFIATLAERNLSSAKSFFVSTLGFNLSVETIRPVYLANESFEATVKATSAEGKPIKQSVTLKVFETTSVDGKVGERLVEQHELTTDEKTGVARQTLTIKTGGKFLLRAEATDRFENPISSERVVRLSDDKDRTRLRLLADRHTFKAGDMAEVNLHWREKPALALVTYQGAKVLKYELIELKQGDNKLSLPMTANLAPNFELAVAVMTDPRDAKKETGPNARPAVRLHAASSPFTVVRDLNVSVAIRPKGKTNGTPKPGDEVEAIVTTTDPQGRPVAAEVSLAMIEQSLLDRFNWPNAPIDDFFRAARRETAVRTTASVTFVYRPRTEPINPRLLAEEDRKELEVLTESSLASGLIRDGFGAGASDEAGRPFVTSVVPTTPDSSYFAESYSGTTLAIPDPSNSPWEADVDGDGASLSADRQTIAGPDGIATIPGDAGSPNLQLEVQQRQTLNSPQNEELLDQTDGDGVTKRFIGGVQGQTWAAAGERGESLSASRLGEDFAINFGRSFVPATEQSIRDSYRYSMGDVTVQLQFDNGTMANHFSDFSGESFDVLARQLREQGALLMPGLAPQETGYWNPAVATGADGKATVSFALPNRSTAWKLVARGITVETLCGEATDALEVKKELFGELKAPAALSDGDEAEWLVTIHNQAIDKGQIKATLKTTIGGKTMTEERTIDAAAKGVSELAFKQPIRMPEGKDRRSPATDVQIELVVESGEHRDVLRRVVPLEPFGMSVFNIAGGSAESNSTAWVEAPENVADSARTLQIVVGPSIERSLLDVLFGAAPRCQIDNLRIASSIDSSTSDLMAAVALQKLIAKTRDGDRPQVDAIDARARGSLGMLVAAQNDDGGWSWTGKGGASNRYTSARVVWALSLAKGAGYVVPEDTFARGVNFVGSQVAATSQTDFSSKAVLLHALAAAGRDDFALANRLFRDRQTLSTDALLHLALALEEMDRDPMAEEILKIVAARPLDPVTPLAEGAASRQFAWSQASAEWRALYSIALQKTSPGATANKELVEWLLAHRAGARWSPDKATGPAMIALCSWQAQNRFDGEHYKLAVLVNDRNVAELDVDVDSLSHTIDVPLEHLGPGRQKVNFILTGRGRYSYQCILGGFVPADKLASTTKQWSVERRYQPAPMEFDGKPIPRGFAGLEGSFKSFRNPLAQLPVGRRGEVELIVRRYAVDSSTPEQDLEYLVVTEPIPGGATVVEQSITGDFERYEISPGSITFYIGSRRYGGVIRYDLHGYVPGSYRSAPTIVRDAYSPDKIAAAKPKTLAVLPLGAESSDVYRLSPQELFELGKLNYAKHDYKAAGEHLSKLLADWNLQAGPYKESARMLLDVNLEVGPPASVVKYFEIIKEKWPDLEVSFDKIMKVGAAYHEMGEYERSYLVFRATVESSFSRENGVAGFLQSQGEFVRSVNVMERILAEYPPEPYVAAATYYLAQEVFAKSAEAAADAKLREEKILGVDLIAEAHVMLDDFLTAYPNDPAADQAAFSAANALLELKAFDGAIAACNDYARRYPKSEYLDSYWYLIGFCHFARSEHEQALDMCRKVADAKRTDPHTGRPTEAANKWQAIYIMGQVYHSQGQAAEAIHEYERVKDRFADAAQAIDYFAHKEIKLPEVSTFKPGEEVKVKLAFRNVPQCDVKVYRIDLMKFSLLRRNLGQIRQINLAGIGARHEETIELGDGKDYRDREKEISLPIKEEGAYLVVARGDELHSSGLALVTPLEVEVQEEAESGRVRTTVKDKAKGTYVSDVHVKTIGSRNSDFMSGKTDLRGVFIADGIQGKSTVIAQASPGRYAFHRGSVELGPPPPAPNQPGKPGNKSQQMQEGKPADLLENLRVKNSAVIEQQRGNLKQIYQQDKQGVAPEAAF